MPNTCCDLHLHTHYSDGGASPAEVLRHAAAIGLRTVSITDHDNVYGAQEAAYVAEVLGLELIPGVELTCRWEACQPMDSGDALHQDVDVLGYFIDPKDPDFLRFTANAMDDLRRRIADCCRLLTTAGYPVNIYDVLEENLRYPGAVQLITALWHRGYAGSWQDAYLLFARYWPQVRPSGHTLTQGIDAIHAAGGVAVLAHPISIRCGGDLLNRDSIARLAAMGLDGLEVIHPRLDSEARQHFLELARSFDLLVTGGSDEHGSADSFSRMGSELVTRQMVRDLRDRAGRT